jgi:hypothetical protein
VAGDKISRAPKFEDASAKLKDGLESCHNVVENYRVMLKGDAVDEVPANAPAEAPEPEESIPTK